ncbi:MAG: hypothetical protein ABIA37_04015 [Candidatus Woesearchaeota archaeon]
MNRKTLGLLTLLIFLGVVLFLGSIGEDLNESGVSEVPTGAVVLDRSSVGKGLNEVTVPEQNLTEEKNS